VRGRNHTRVQIATRGFKVNKRFSDTCNSPIVDNEFGRLEEITAQNGEREKRIRFTEEISVENILFYIVIKRLALGEKRVKKGGDSQEVVCETKTNYWMPFYWLVLESYLDLRGKLEPILVKNPSPQPTIGYFLETFSEADANIGRGIRSCI
jgi:hypothetical protein